MQFHDCNQIGFDVMFTSGTKKEPIRKLTYDSTVTAVDNVVSRLRRDAKAAEKDAERARGKLRRLAKQQAAAAARPLREEERQREQQRKEKREEQLREEERQREEERKEQRARLHQKKERKKELRAAAKKEEKEQQQKEQEEEEEEQEEEEDQQRRRRLEQQEEQEQAVAKKKEEEQQQRRRREQQEEQVGARRASRKEETHEGRLARRAAARKEHRAAVKKEAMEEKEHEHEHEEEGGEEFEIDMDKFESDMVQRRGGPANQTKARLTAQNRALQTVNRFSTIALQRKSKKRQWAAYAEWFVTQAGGDHAVAKRHCEGIVNYIDAAQKKVQRSANRTYKGSSRLLACIEHRVIASLVCTRDLPDCPPPPPPPPPRRLFH